MNWRLKALLQRGISGIPHGLEAYGIGQRIAGRLRAFRIERRLPYAVEHWSRLQEQGFDLQGKAVVEVGTGWAPVLPLFFWLCGTCQIDTFDVIRWLQPNLVQQSVAQLCELIRQARSSASAGKKPALPVDQFVSVRIEELRRHSASPFAWEEMLARLGIRYHAPADAGQTHFASQSRDLVFSNLVLELVPVDDLHRMFQEAHRILRPGGLMAHKIDLGDQFASADPSVSSTNFLRYSSAEFDRYNSRICNQNRLRSPTYRNMIQESGFDVVAWDAQVDRDALHHLLDMNVAAEFRPFTAEELCTTSLFVLAKKQAR